MTTTTTLPEQGTDAHRDLVALQNDQFRRWHCLGERKPGIFVPGRSVWTAAFEAEPDEFKQAAVRAIGAFTAFTPENDPDGFHDYGSATVQGRAVWFKIDLYDRDYRYGSDDPADLTKTARVLTVLFPSDW